MATVVGKASRVTVRLWVGSWYVFVIVHPTSIRSPPLTNQLAGSSCQNFLWIDVHGPTVGKCQRPSSSSIHQETNTIKRLHKKKNKNRNNNNNRIQEISMLLWNMFLAGAFFQNKPFLSGDVSFLPQVTSFEEMSSLKELFVLPGAVGGSHQPQEAVPNRSVLPHLWSGGPYGGAGDRLCLHLPSLLYISGEFRSSLTYSDNSCCCCHMLTRKCPPPPHHQQIPEDSLFHCRIVYEDSIYAPLRGRQELEENVGIYLDDNYEQISVPVPHFGGSDPADIIHDFQRVGSQPGLSLMDFRLHNLL